MDQQLITLKLESLRRCLHRVSEKQPENLQQLESDLDLQDILVLNLTRAVQICVDIASHVVARSDLVMPGTMGETFAALHKLGVIDETVSSNLRKAVGFRNVAVHNYDEVEWAIVYAIATRHQQDFKTFASQIIAYIEQQGG